MASLQRILRRKRARKENHVILWRDCSIPAKLFFDELIKGNVNVLGNAPLSELEKVYWSIMDEYVKESDNHIIASYLEKQRKISIYTLQISTIQSILYAITYVRNTEVKKQLINQLNNLNEPCVNFIFKDINNRDEILSEVSRVQNEVIGSIENEIEILKMNDKEYADEKGMSFEQRLDAIQGVLAPEIITDSISLKMFIQKEKRALKIANKHGK